MDGTQPVREEPPYVRRFKLKDGAERYVLATEQLNAPAWTLRPQNYMDFTSDAGAYSLFGKESGSIADTADQFAAISGIFFQN